MNIKRLVTILCVTAAIAIAVPTDLQAKTSSKRKANTTATSKRSGNGKPFTAATIIQKGTCSNGFESNMEGTLRRMGFTESRNVFTRNGLSIDFNDPLNLKVTFPNTADRDKFIEETKEMGYEWDGTKCLNGKNLALDIAVDGNTVSVFFPE